MAETTITTTAGDLHEFIADLIPFAEQDKMSLPILNCVHLRGHGDEMTAVATDRYAVGMKRAPIKAPVGFVANVPLAAVKQILRTFKRTRANDPELELTFDGEKVTVTMTGGFLGEALGAEMAWHTFGGAFPGIASIFRPFEDGAALEPAAGFALNPLLLAKFSHLAGPLTFHPTGVNAVCVVRSATFFGAIMPVRFTEGGVPPTNRDVESIWKKATGEPSDEKKPVEKTRVKKVEAPA